MKKRILSFILSIILILSVWPGTSVSAESPYAYTVTPQLTKATIDYLNEIYVKKYPQLGLEFMYGGDADKASLKQLADVITKGCTTSEDKAIAISYWARQNLKYQSILSMEVPYYPMDVWRQKYTNCLGYALMMTELMRLKNIPTVMCAGQTGSMKNYYRLDNVATTMGHAWVYAYYNNEWHLYDPLFNNYGITDTNKMAELYFPIQVEGINMAYDGMDKKIAYNGTGIYYENDKFMFYAQGIPALEYYGTDGADWLGRVNDEIAYMAKIYSYNPDTYVRCGYEYIDKPTTGMQNNQCMTDGWFTYGEEKYFAKPNGLLYSNTIKKRNNQLYFMAFDGSAIPIKQDYRFVNGYPAVEVGKTYQVIPDWVESEKKQGRIIIWEVQKETSENLISVDQNGVITAKAPGLATVSVYSKDSADSDTHYMWTYIQISVVNKMIIPLAANEKAAQIPDDIKYSSALLTGSAHIQTYGDTNGTITEKDGYETLVLGSRGKGKRLEAITLNFNNTTGYQGEIEYRVHRQTYGWTNWMKSTMQAGTVGQATRLEGIQIRLTGELAKHYDIRYRAHIQTYGDNQGWVYNGALAGTTGEGKRLEEIQIQLIPKDTSGQVASVHYRVHRQTYGWENKWAKDGQVSGTVGQAKRLEGITITVDNPKYSGGIRYKTHVQSFGWMNWAENGELSGTYGRAKRLEAIQIELTGEMKNHYDIYYRVHAQSFGWLGWAKNGESSGTAGYAKRLEAIQILLVPKGGSAPSNNYLGINANRKQAFISK